MIKILYVEDESDLREDLIEELQEDGFEVAWAPNGAEGLRMLGTFKPDLVISDCLMPVMTGIEMFKEMRARYPDFASTPFIFLSAHAQKEHIEEGLGAGANGYLTKPVDYAKLLKAIRAICDEDPDALARCIRGTNADSAARKGN
jgi:DNA-binding response OmpR family regulator